MMTRLMVLVILFDVISMLYIACIMRKQQQKLVNILWAWPFFIIGLIFWPALLIVAAWQWCTEKPWEDKQIARDFLELWWAIGNPRGLWRLDPRISPEY